MYDYISFEDLIIYYKINDIEVYKPAEDSFLIIKNLNRFLDKDKKILDLGCGSGIIGLYSYKYTKNITFADIDLNALFISKINFYINYIKRDNNINEIIKNINDIKFPINFIQTNLFENIDERFDIIIFNPPYLPEIPNEDEKTKRWVSGGTYGNEIILKFLGDLKDHLNNNGFSLLLFSSLSDPYKIIKRAKDLNYKYELIDKQKLFFEELYLYKIYI